MKIWMGPTGRLVVGNVLDVRQKELERAMKFYDPQLYIRWNPKKRDGWGCWEVRRLPAMKTRIPVATYEGVQWCLVEYWETDIVNHILDTECLNYDLLRHLKEIDTWNDPNWVDTLEKKRIEYRDTQAAKNKEDMRYNFKQHKREIREFKEAVASGINPLDFFQGKYKS